MVLGLHLKQSSHSPPLKTKNQEDKVCFWFTIHNLLGRKNHELCAIRQIHFGT